MTDVMGEGKRLEPNFERHPVIPAPHPAWVGANEEQAAAYVESRTRTIHLEEVDPLLHGYEPPIWKVVDALFGFECFDKSFEEEIRERFGEDWDWWRWSEAMRLALGFPAPVSIVLINGGNRGGKSQYAGKRSVQRLYRKANQRVWCLHADHPMSVEYQQALVNDHLPVAKRSAKILEGKPEYISYKTAIGFTNNKFVTHDKSICVFKYYSADKSSTIEGGEVDFIWNDELVPADWVDTERMRIATRNGKILITFTPVEGYTECVRMFQEGADTVREAVGFLCPNDEGPPLEAQALGFESVEQYRYAQTYGPNSLPEDVHAWIEDVEAAKGREDGKLNPGAGQPPVPEGRKFKTVPRVMRPVGQMRSGKIQYNSAVVFFHSADNPYGNPEGVLDMVAGKSMEFVKERFYGLANKTRASRFPLFNDKVHVLPADKIPEGGTNYMVCDPSGGRNFTMAWFRVVGNCVYLYREWPGNYPIMTKNIGMPGPWAEVDGKKKDGRKGDAQSPFGFDLLDYKEEIARLEGWEIPPELTDRRDWQPGGEGCEEILERYIDTRPANTNTTTAEGTITLLDELADIGLDFVPVSVARHDLQLGRDGSTIHLINNALSYDPQKKVGFTNRPHFYVSEQCYNSIFALKIWTGDDQQRGACKDFIDLIRYFFAQDFVDVGEKGSYGTIGGARY